MSYRLHETEVLHNERVRAHVGGELRGFHRAFKLPVVHKRVERDVYLTSPDMAVAHRLFKFFVGEVLRTAAGVEAAETEINRVRAVLHGGNDRFGGACR